MRKFNMFITATCVLFLVNRCLFSLSPEIEMAEKQEFL